MPRKSHPHKEIEDALRYAERAGWRIASGGSHAWGKMYCPRNSAECRCGEFCITSIAGTPRNPSGHARKIRRVVDHCTETGRGR
jgi:hypothetical protein